MMDMQMLRLFVRQVLEEAKKNNLLGEPDTTTEKHRDEPQPQYEEEEEDDIDEFSGTPAIAGHTGPLGATGHGPGNKPYDSDEDEK